MKPGRWIDDPLAEAAYLLDCDFTEAGEWLSNSDIQLAAIVGDLAQEALISKDPRMRLHGQRHILQALLVLGGFRRG